MHSVFLYGLLYEMQKRRATNYQFLFGLQNKFRKIPFLATYCLDNFDDLIQSGFWVIAEITLANLRKPVHVVITILVPSDPYESRNCGK